MSENENENEKEQTTQQSALDFLPDTDEIEDAAGVCSDYASYLKEAKSKATRDIDILKEAADILYAAVTFYDDFAVGSDVEK